MSNKWDSIKPLFVLCFILSGLTLYSIHSVHILYVGGVVPSFWSICKYPWLDIAYGEIYGFKHLNNYDVIIVGGCKINTAFSEEELMSLIEYVKNGGTLIFVGGSSSYGSGEWNKSIIYDILPVIIKDQSDYIKKHCKVTLENFEFEFSGYNAIAGVKYGADILAYIEIENEVSNRLPAIVEWKVGRGKVICLMINDPVGTSQLGQKFWLSILKIGINNYNLKVLKVNLLASAYLIFIFLYLIRKRKAFLKGIKDYLNIEIEANDKKSFKPYLVSILIVIIVPLIICSPLFAYNFPSQIDIGSEVSIITYLSNDLRKYRVFPIWSSYPYYGSPEIISPSPHFIHIPFAVIALFTDSIFATKLALVLSIIIAGIGMTTYTYKITKHYLSASISGLIYEFSPFFISEVFICGHIPLSFSYAIIPYTLIFLDPNGDKISAKNIIISSWFMTLLILTAPQIWFMWVPFWYAVITFNRIKNRNCHAVFVALMVLTLNVLLAAFWLFPTVLIKSEDIGFKSAIFGLKASDLYSCKMPQVFTLNGYGPYFPKYWMSVGLLPITTIALYMPFSLAVSSFILKRNRRTFSFMLLSFASFVMACGTHIFISPYKILFNYITFFRHIRTPDRYQLISPFFVSFLSGYYVKIIFEHKQLNSLLKRKGILKYCLLIFICSILFLSNTGVSVFCKYSKGYKIPDCIITAYDSLDTNFDNSILALLDPWPEPSENTYIKIDWRRARIHDLRLTSTYFIVSHEACSITGAPSHFIAHKDLLGYIGGRISTRILIALRSGNIERFLQIADGLWNLKYIIIYKNTSLIPDKNIEKLIDSEKFDLYFENPSIIVLEKESLPKLWASDGSIIAFFGSRYMFDDVIMPFELNIPASPIIYIPYEEFMYQDFNNIIDLDTVLIIPITNYDYLYSILFANALEYESNKNKCHMYEAENFISYGWKKGQYWVTKGYYVSNNIHATTRKNASLSISINVDHDSNYTIYARIFSGSSYFIERRGKLTVYLDGKLLGYVNNSFGLPCFRIFKIAENIYLTQGEHVVTFINDGSGPNDIDYLAILPHEDAVKLEEKIKDSIQNMLEHPIIHFICEAEDIFKPINYSSIKSYWYINGYETSFNKHLVIGGPKKIGKAVATIYLPRGTYSLYLKVMFVSTSRADRGKLEVYIDGSKYAEFTPYSNFTSWKWIRISGLNLAEGNHKIELISRGGYNDIDMLTFVKGETHSETFSISDKPPIINMDVISIDYKKIAPNKYEVKINNSTKIYGKYVYLYVAEAIFKGWYAKVDGKKIKPIPVNHFLQVYPIPVEDINKTIKIIYRPPMYQLSYISLATFLTQIAILVIKVVLPRLRLYEANAKSRKM